MNVCCGNSATWLKIVTLVGIGIWAVPLVWYYKQKKEKKA